MMESEGPGLIAGFSCCKQRQRRSRSRPRRERGVTMASLKIDLTPEMEHRLKRTAEERGQAAADCARTLLEEKLAEVTSARSADAQPESPDPWAGLPRRAPEELDALAAEQGAPLAVRFETVLGDFWPEEETCDEFIAALRAWRREGAPPSPGSQLSSREKKARRSS
jgi:hypothetical protein